MSLPVKWGVSMIVHCTKCHHESQCVKNNKPCAWCLEPMKSIGSDYMSEKDGSLSNEEIEDEVYHRSSTRVVRSPALRNGDHSGNQ